MGLRTLPAGIVSRPRATPHHTRRSYESSRSHGRIDRQADMTHLETDDRIVSEVIGDGLSVARAAKLLPGRGEGGCSPESCWRHMTKGARSAAGTRIKLESLRIGGVRYTSRGAIERFIRALQDPAPATPPPAPAAQTKRRREVEQAEAELAGLGV